MSMLRKISPFPEYNRIKENLYLRKRRSLEKECQNINVRIKKMRQSVDLEKEHGQILKNIIYKNKKLGIDETVIHEQFKELTIKNKEKGGEGIESINQLIGDEDEESKNYYENHLKFRKKVLERELFSTNNLTLKIKSNRKSKNRKNIQQQMYKYQDLFKNLYKNAQSKGKVKGRRQSGLLKNEDRIKNKKRLTQVYGHYVNKLSNTHIMKWRILNDI